VSLKEKFKTIIGIEDDEYDFDDDFAFEQVEEPPLLDQPTQSKPPLRPAVVSKTNKDKGQVQGMNIDRMSEMSKVVIREPKQYSDAQNIADCLKQNLPVFINLQRLDKSQGKRVIDFLSGTIYAVEGEIQRVGMNLFLCTPKSVETDGTVSEDYNADLGE